jgi:hypothetical protein
MMISQGILWMIFFAGSHKAPLQVSVPVSLLMALNGLLFIGFAFLFDKTRWLKTLALLFLFGNLVLTVTDQMGLLDYIVLACNMVCIAVLIVFKRKPKGSRFGAGR